MKQLIVENGAEERVYTIENNAFESCGNLEVVTFGTQLTKIGESAFKASGVKEIKITTTVTTNKSHVFENCNKLEKVEFINSACDIGESSFEGCCNLGSATLGN